tara:strand:- start:494 stop:778 length:285 start_codon:yes stop_codon:yes gene_type:complete
MNETVVSLSEGKKGIDMGELFKKVLEINEELDPVIDICPEIDNCDYLISKRKTGEIDPNEHGKYLSLVCEGCYFACELNKDKLANITEAKKWHH